MRADNSRHIVDAARNRHEYPRAKAIQALREIDAAGATVTFDTVARAAGVSRSWLHTQPDLRAEIERLRAARRRASADSVPARQRASDASLLRRLEAANERNRRLTERTVSSGSNWPARSASSAPPDGRASPPPGAVNRRVTGPERSQRAPSTSRIGATVWSALGRGRSWLPPGPRWCPPCGEQDSGRADHGLKRRRTN
ncbi:DUF6262 family protein [Streptomyces sp. CT34]|uniref:DUF6262 family protein n=1 Tax=Streptomyces sp. CT34 TaxID=1553907 RepID=UPI0024106416|nr:DUF6262 family protein [Streptomyces sp. CT34]